MKTSKKIDQIYRDKFRGVETTPPADVWQNIATRLPEKKKMRFLPYWYQLAGAAAAIAIILILFNKNNSDPTFTKITQSNNTFPNNGEFEIELSSPIFEESMKTSFNILEAAVMDTKIEVIKSQYEHMVYTTSGLHSAKPANPNVLKEAIAAAYSEKKEESYNNQNSQLKQATYSKEKEQASLISPKVLADLPEQDIKENKLQKIASVKKSEKETLIKESGFKRFSVTPTAAAVFFDTGKGNALDNQYAGKKGGGEISMSYGLNLAYQVSDKVKIRSGFNSVNLSYRTRNIDYASARSSSAITPQENTIIQTSSVNGSLNQDFGFLEIPLEVEFILIDKKLGLNVIGGASTFFLEENKIVLESLNSITEIGAANNLNKTSFSANLGLGVNYNISSKFRFNLEPIFKYQINTFNSSSNSNSYYLGIYSGLSFKF